MKAKHKKKHLKYQCEEKIQLLQFFIYQTEVGLLKKEPVTLSGLLMPRAHCSTHAKPE